MEWSELKNLAGPIKLNIGGRFCMDGKANFCGWVSVDRKGGWFHHSISHTFPDPMPLPDECVDAILSEHFLEHITQDHGVQVLEDCARVLKPTCRARIAVPDTNHPLHESSKGQRSAWCAASLSDAMRLAGFSRVCPMSYWTHVGGECYQHTHRSMSVADGWVSRTIENDQRNSDNNALGELTITSLIVDGEK